MAKFQSPLLGYNNNVRYKGRVFHIQTEDSGVQHPHVITHLFMDGGRILKSIKKSYAELVGNDDLSNLVRQLMKEQHKAMFIALREGQFDQVIDPNAAPRATEAKPVPSSETKAPSEKSIKVNPPATDAKAPSEKSIKVNPPATDAKAPSEKSIKVNPPATEPRAPSTGGEPARELPRAPAIRPKTMPSISTAARPHPADDPGLATRRTEQLAPVRPAAKHPSSSLRAAAPPRLMLDFEGPDSSTDVLSQAYEKQAAPPAPGAVTPAVGTYRTSDTSAKHQIDRVEIPDVMPKVPKRPSSRPPPEGRYAPARPASIFDAQAKARPASSIFSDDLISDKSLDEVILSYLAEDLDPPRRK